MEKESQPTTANLQVPEIMHATEEIILYSKQILHRAKTLGLIDDCTGYLPIVLNTIASKAFTQTDDIPEEIAILQNQITNFAIYYNSTEAQKAVPFFGIEVYEDEDDNIYLIFGD